MVTKNESLNAIPVNRSSLYTQNGELIQSNTNVIQNESMDNLIAVIGLLAFLFNDKIKVR